MTDKPNRRKRTKKQVSKGRRIASFILEALLIGAGLLTLYHGLFLTTPEVAPRTQPETIDLNYHSATIPALITNQADTAFTGQYIPVATPRVEFFMLTTFEAKGGFGADNPISVKVVISNVVWLNSTASGPLTNYYCCFKLSGAVRSSYPPNFDNGWLPLTDNGNGTYTASGSLEWTVGGPTYSWVLPNFPNGYPTSYSLPDSLYSDNGTRTPTLTIDPIADTQAWRSAQSTLQVEWVGVSAVFLGISVENARRILNQTS